MSLIRLCDASAGTHALIAVERGLNCFEFQAVVNGSPLNVLDSHPEFAQGQGRPSGNGIPILFPFPNRIRQGRFLWDGCEYQLSDATVGFDNAGNAIHGFCLDRTWRVVEQSDAHVIGQFQLSRDAPDRLSCWPGDFVFHVGYRLRGNTLTGTYRIQNPGPAPLPWGLGTHPYFRLPLGTCGSADDCLIQVPARRQWVLEDCLPSGQRAEIPLTHDLREGARFGDVTLDHVLSDLEATAGRIECQLVDSASGLQVTQRADSCFRECVVYTPPERNCVCLEPYTCVTDAVNLEPDGVDSGWRVLPPGGEFSCQIEILAGLVLV